MRSQKDEEPRLIRGVPDITKKRTGIIVQLERKRQRLSLDELGTRVGIDHSTLSQYEHGRRPIPAARAEALAKELGIDVALIDPDAA